MDFCFSIESLAESKRREEIRLRVISTLLDPSEAGLPHSIISDELPESGSLSFSYSIFCKSISPTLFTLVGLGSF